MCVSRGRRSLQRGAAASNPEQLGDPRWWTDVEKVRAGLERIAGEASPVGSLIASFELTDAFNDYCSSQEVVDTREYRHVIVHRERPSYREAPGFGRVTRWREGTISFEGPEPSEVELAAYPTLTEQRALVAAALDRTLDFAQTIWDLALRFLATVDVDVVVEGEHVRITTLHQDIPGVGAVIRFPRKKRDPMRFIRTDRA
jgi:hypothetical protein